MGFIAPLRHMSDSPVATIEADRVGCQQSGHGRTQIPRGRLHQGVEMVRHGVNGVDGNCRRFWHQTSASAA
jgi:hypothetical protein